MEQQQQQQSLGGASSSNPLGTKTATKRLMIREIFKSTMFSCQAQNDMGHAAEDVEVIITGEVVHFWNKHLARKFDNVFSNIFKVRDLHRPMSSRKLSAQVSYFAG